MVHGIHPVAEQSDRTNRDNPLIKHAVSSGRSKNTQPRSFPLQSSRSWQTHALMPIRPDTNDTINLISENPPSMQVRNRRPKLERRIHMGIPRFRRFRPSPWFKAKRISQGTRQNARQLPLCRWTCCHLRRLERRQKHSTMTQRWKHEQTELPSTQTFQRTQFSPVNCSPESTDKSSHMS